MLFKEAFTDLYEAIKKNHLWLTLAWFEIKARYRRTVIGPLWLTLGTAITIFGLALLWSTVFRMNILAYLPHIATGMIFWVFISSVLVDSCTAFLSQEALIRNINNPLSIYIFTMLARNIIILFHNLPLLVLVFFLCHQEVSLTTLLVIPGLIALVLNALWVALLLSILGTRYRDSSAIIGNFLTVIMMLTPIMWKVDMLPEDRKFIGVLNPCTHFLNIVRDPLLGKVPDPLSYYVTSGIFIVGTLVALWLYKKYIHRIVFWL